MWDLIINPFITVLTLLYGLLGENIVLSIAVFTVIIRLATSPLLIQQQRSMKAQQEIQPKIQELREKYKNDREKLAQAQMELFKEAGVNPLGGCLPLFIQLPILLGLYQAIIHALAGTPFQLIDLSGRLLIPGLDPYVPLNNMWIGMDLTLPPTANPAYALSLPLLVLVTTWLQSKLTVPEMPSGGDGQMNQAANMTRTMTTIMPLMFGFFSLSFSVGLSIYFVVSNVVGIVQYTLMGRAEWGRLLGRASADDAVKSGNTQAAKAKTAAPSAAAVTGKKAVVSQEKAADAEKVPATPNTDGGGSKQRSKKIRKMKRQDVQSQ